MNSIWRYYCFLLRKHLLSWRMLAVVIITLITMDTFMIPIRIYSQSMVIKMSQWGFALIWNNKYVRLCFMLIYVFASAILPEDRKKECYIISRMGLSKWVSGQFLYLITFGWIYTFFMYLCMNLLLLNVIEFIPQWGPGWGTLINNNVRSEFNIYISVSSLVISNYDPVYANILVVLIMGLLLGMMGMLLFWLNFYSKIASSVVASTVIFINLAAARNGALQKYSPVSWVRLDGHYRITAVNQPTVTYIIGMLVLLTLLFLMLAKEAANHTQENGRRRK